MPSNIFIITVTLIAIVFSAITTILGLFTKRRVLKLLPAILSGIAALGFFIKAKLFATGFEDIGYMILAFIAGVISVISMLTAVIMDYVRRRK